MSALDLTRRSSFFFAAKVCISADAEEINQHADHIPHNHGSRNNQDAIVDPEDLKEAYDSRHPWVHARSRPAPEHRQQIRQNGKGGAQTGDKAKNIRTLEIGKEDALRVMNKLLTAAEHDHQSERWNTEQYLLQSPHSGPPNTNLFVQGVHKLWNTASTDLTGLLQSMAPKITTLVPEVLAASVGFGLTVLQFVLSIVVAGGWHVRAVQVLPVRLGDYALGSPQSRAAARTVLARRLAGQKRVETIIVIPRPHGDGIRIGEWTEGEDGTLTMAVSI